MKTLRISIGLVVATTACGSGSSSSTAQAGDASGDAAHDAIEDARSDVAMRHDGGAHAADAAADASSVPPGACAGYQKYKQAFFGDLHTHTILSADAWGMGTRNEPVDAYS